MGRLDRLNKKYDISVVGKQEFMGKEIIITEGGFGEGYRVLSDKQIAEIHEQAPKKIRETINNNIKRFKEGMDLIDIKRALDTDTLTNLGYAKQSITQAQHIYLLSERGYAKLIKIMDSDLAWEIHDKLIDDYFKMRKIMRVLTKEQELVLDVYAGGIEALEANKSLIKMKEDEIQKNAAIEIEKAKEEAKKKINALKDGNNKLMTVTQLVDSLGILGLSTSIFNQWLCDKGFGEYKLFPRDKRKTFQPNEYFKKYIAGVGFSLTGTTKKKNKIVVMYNEEMRDRIINKYYDELHELVKKEEEIF